MGVRIKQVRPPVKEQPDKKIMLTDETMAERRKKVLERMKAQGLSSLIIYADKEHGSNFEYLTGFIPRFEEALLIVNSSGQATLILGNENFNKAQYSRILAEGIKCPLFSLPNQPMRGESDLKQALQTAAIDTSQSVGVAGWKLIPEGDKVFDLPHFILDQLKSAVGADRLVNATGLFIGPEEGVRIKNNANEIAHYAFGAALASDGVLEAMDALRPGVREFEIGGCLNQKGQYATIVTIGAFGERFIQANLYPTERQLTEGDKVALTVAYKGGLSSRSGYAVASKEALEKVDPGYLEDVVLPYFEAYVYWLTHLKIGVKGSDFYVAFDSFYPRQTYGWELCPGHLTADEEWLSSPFYEGSDARVQSGMIFQVDFIPKQAGHQGVSAESTVAVADDTLREAIRQLYPDLWKRILDRRAYIKEVLCIDLPKELLPLAGTLAYYRPYLLDSHYALTWSD
ncbi:hypothetical protein ADIAL_1174 [Alkalibacterium sp. AK22]|uniref:M24 family metallopeptidase n=1 Tax=Alkalibacterium sp. AK22 TaxID=1229520 RepID=UPI00044EBAE0|nr:aminopeptidase P family N-terminal domain-containing protein [Alkalibacterium sp. AK22]EXJ23369.1 hypothetical protein ADIAL_1174 [Alkalibacterium sp. AK22]